MKYIVSFAIDARIDISVEAKTPEEARKRAEKEILFCGDDLEWVGFKAVNCEGEDGSFVDF